jgi:hypothetical protein
MTSNWRRPLVCLPALILTLCSSSAGLLKFTDASVSPRNPKVGDKVTLTYKIYDAVSTSSPDPRMPSNIQAGGMTFSLDEAVKQPPLLGVGAHYFRATYTARAERAGSFKVPSVRLSAGGERIKTKPLTFRVSGKPEPEEEKPPFDRSKVPALAQMERVPSSSPARPVPRPAAAPAPRPAGTAATPPAAPAPAVSAPMPAPTVPPAGKTGPSPVGKGSMEIPAGEIFVGQSVPITLRFPLRVDDQFEGPLTQPVLAGEGFTGSAWRTEDTTTFTTNGVAFNLIVLKGTIVPFRAGALKIPDLSLTGRRLSGGSLGPAFPGKFPAPSGGGWVDYSVKAEGREIKVAELPEEGKPEDFTGAVGAFSTLPLEASPVSAKAGEPVTLKVRIRLQPGSTPSDSNMASVSGPELDQDTEWRHHGPKAEFDVAQMVKTFEYTLFARTKTTKSPSAHLSYFDPRQKKYLRLDWPAIDLHADGPAPGSDDARTAASNVPASPASSPTGPPSAAFVWPSLPEISWPAILRAAFWPVSILVCTFLFLWAARIFLRRRREANAMLKAALSEAWDRLDAAGDNPAAFYASAAGVIAARLALWRGKTGALDDLGEQLNRLVSNVPLREDLAAVLARRDELNYGAADSSELRPGEREAVCASLEKFCEDVA